MSLEIYSGNMFDVDADTYVVTVNMVGAMGAGVAKTARDTIPGLYKHYKKMLPKVSPGNFIGYNYNGKRYIMIATKLDWRAPSPRDMVIINLHRFARLTRKHNMGVISIPPFGCGNGGLSWENDMQYMYRALFEDHPSHFIVSI